jgi:hypothetical protein
MAMDSRGRTLRLLLDTNIVIAHEDDDPACPDDSAEAAQALVQQARELGFELLVSDGTRRDFLGAPEPRRSLRQRSFRKYYTRLAPVPTNAAVRKEFPTDLTANDVADLEVLSAYATGAATALVTEDRRMRARASRAGLGNVFGLEDAIDWLRALQAPALVNAAAAHMPAAYQVSRAAAIFGSLEAEYDDFGSWWDKVVDERRPVIVLGDPADPSGIAVLKEEFDNPFDLGARVLKICTFKVDEGAGGSRRGELLLRAVVDYAVERSHETAYLTVWEHHRALTGWLESFGFRPHGRNGNGELVRVKRFARPEGAPALAPLEHNIEYGPRALRIDRMFVVPIQDRFHNRLFPDSDDQGSLLENESCGNAIRKAYLCHSNSRLLIPGDTLAFLHTGAGESHVTAVGVVEQTLASDDPTRLAAFVAGRTVYSYHEICSMCDKEVLAVLFRLDRRVAPSWARRTLISKGVIRASPNSIATVPLKGVEWARTQLVG